MTACLHLHLHLHLHQAGVWGDTRQGAAAMARVQRGLTMEEVEAFCGEDCPILPALR